MRHTLHSLTDRTHQRGAVLLVALILLLILSLLAVTTARMQTVEERMARNEDNRQIGAAQAEAALRSAEGGLLSGNYTNFASGANGLYELTGELSTYGGSLLSTIDWSSPTQVLTYSGPALSAVPAAQPPKYIIESLPPVAVPGSPINEVQYGNASQGTAVYRITARGVGADGTSTTTLQSIFTQ